MPDQNTANNYLNGPIIKTMLATGLAMIPATLAMSLFNIVDTYFVSRLGVNALAAMGFCFPIVGIISCIFHSVSTAVMTLLSHAIGRKDERDASSIVFHGIIFMLLSSVFIGILGSLIFRPLCALWVTTPEVLEFVCQFMIVWLLGSFTISLGMCTNKLVLALGYPRASAIWMIAALVLNAILEPIFIFGLGPIPRLEMYGAAIATVIAQSITPVGCLYILQKRLHIFNRDAIDKSAWLNNFWRITKFSIPTILGMIIMPLSGFVATTLAAHFNDKVVAAMACISRLETMAFVVPMSIGMALMPMFAQNYGAKQFERIDDIRRLSMRFAGIFLLVCAAIFTLLAKPMVSLFTDDPEVIDLATFGMRIVCWGFWGQEVHRFSGFVFNGCNRPTIGALFNIVKIVLLLIPLMLLSLAFDDVNWIFYGRLLSEVIAAIIAFLIAKYFVSRLKKGTSH